MEVEVAPYWNVNALVRASPVLSKFVEVAPYWNVNLNMYGNTIKFVSVEVAPYWNVNELSHICISVINP